MAGPDERDLLSDLTEGLETDPDPSARAAAPPPVPPPLPQHRRTTLVALPVAVPKGPPGDPFQEAPEPRPPRSGNWEEKLEFLRAVVRQKQEALERGRALYAQVAEEAAELRQAAQALQGQVEERDRRLQDGEEERRELRASLAGLEGKHLALSAELQRDRGVRLAQETEARKLHTRFEELKARLAVAERDVQELERQLSSAVSAKHALERQFAEDSQAMGRIRERVAESALDPAAERSVADEVDALVDEVVMLRRLVADAENPQLRRVREDLVAANRKALDATAALQRERREREGLEVRLKAALEGKPNPLDAGKLRALEDALEETRRQRAALEARTVELTQQLAARDAALAAAQEDVAQLKAERAALDARLKESRSSNTKRASPLRMALEKERARREELEAELKRLEQHPKALLEKTAEVNTLRDEVAALRRKAGAQGSGVVLGDKVPTSGARKRR